MKMDFELLSIINMLKKRKSKNYDNKIKMNEANLVKLKWAYIDSKY